jgi:hypothetical protein
VPAISTSQVPPGQPKTPAVVLAVLLEPLLLERGKGTARE